MQIDIIDPKAAQLLRDLADMNLISIRKKTDNGGFLDIVKKIRARASEHSSPSFDEITAEVEKVRAEKHAKSKGSNNH